MSDRSTRTQAGDALRTRAVLQVWLSPSFPIGAYAYSHGLERAVELGWVRDRSSLEAWLTDLCSHGGLRNDLILIVAAFGARDDATLQNIADLSVALQPSAERHLEATQQGASFVQQIDATWPAPHGSTLSVRFADTQPTLAVALGAAVKAHDLQLHQALDGYAIAFVSNLVSAAIRLSVIGQSDGQRIVAASLPTLAVLATDARLRTLADLGSAAFRSDIASMQHEIQRTRLFRS